MKKLVLLLVSIMLFLCFPMQPVRAAEKWEGLKGIQSFELLTVYANPYDQDPAKAREALQKGAMDILTQNHLPLKAGKDTSAGKEKTRLKILIGVIPQPFCGPSKLYEIEIVMQEPFTRDRVPKVKNLHDVWKLHTHGLIPDPETEGMDMVEHALYNVEEFARDFLEANTAAK